MALSKKKKVLLAVLSVMLVIFAAMNAVWFYYRYTYFDKVIAQHPEFVDDEDGDNVPSYVYRDETLRALDTTFNYGVAYPRHYLSWTGNYGLAQNIYIDFDHDNQVINEYVIDIIIRPILFNGYMYDLQVVDYTDYQRVYHMEIDRDGNLLHDNAGDADIILSKASAEIKEALDAVNVEFNL